MALGISGAPAKSKAVDGRVPWAGSEPRGAAFSAWLEIAADDTVTVHVPEPEIGNGAMTQVAMTIAEELNCDWTRVRAVFASIQRNHLENQVYAIGFQPFFGGHFPARPVMPGVLILEALAQAAALLSFESMDVEPGDDMVVYFVGIDGARFKRPVEPGDQLLLEASIERAKSGIYKYKTRAMVGSETAAEAELMCTMRKVA